MAFATPCISQCSLLKESSLVSAPHALCCSSSILHSLRSRDETVKQLHLQETWKREHRILPKRMSGTGVAFCASSEIQEPDDNFRRVQIHYNRRDGKYGHWGLHIWGEVKVPTLWESPLPPAGSDDFGIYWEVTFKYPGILNFLVHKGDLKDCAGSTSGSNTSAIWMVSKYSHVFLEKPDPDSILKGSLRMAHAYWVKEDMLAWVCPTGDAVIYLHASKMAKLFLTERGIEGADVVIKLESVSHGLPAEVVEKFPHIKGYTPFKLPVGCNARELVKCQLALSSFDANGVFLDATGLQLPGVLDELFAYDGPLGVNFIKDGIMLHLWAPTAQSVYVFLYSSPSGGEPYEVLALNEINGIWSIHGPSDWKGKYYLYEITVFHPTTQKVERSLANDPYSLGLSANGERSLIVDLNDGALQPEAWTQLADEKPALKSFTDSAIYELHIRDFRSIPNKHKLYSCFLHCSISDDSVDPSLRGTYLAFAVKDSAGMRHLKEIADAGLTHVHLLPAFDFASVDERKERWKYVDCEKLAKFLPDSEEQQAAVVEIQNEDGYNWGYDPVNWGVPEGSYALEPDGSQRTLEFRTMVQDLNRIGLRVIMDVVYNHVFASGPEHKYSVLDKVVPGYYLRRNKDGDIENSTCMNNTASEHIMVDRMIVDNLRHWAVNYKVDGFRFDLMGHLMKRTMVRAKNVLQNLTIEKDGVDGSKIYLYGEGWDFGEVARNGRGINAAQCNLATTGIGSFNDRIRDSVLGGSPFGDPRQQGFVTGLYLQPNAFDQGDGNAMKRALAAMTDWIRLGLAGNLRNIVLTNFQGEEVKGIDVLTHDQMPVAYAANPEETVNYVSAHDNETLFDIIMLKTAREVSLEDRCRINHLATSIIALSQGIPFFHAGDDMLRSKSLDRDSYNSGDWFNRLDFTYESNNWGIGLPPKEKNENKWSLMGELLSDDSLNVKKQNILLAKESFQSFLKIRYSSPLFRLRTANDIQERIRFHNTGPTSIPGVILMSIADGDEGKPGLSQLDMLYQQVVVAFNARPTELTIHIPAMQATNLSLHPVQAVSADKMVRMSSFETLSGTFKIPARTAAVFVELRHCYVANEVNES